MKKYRKISQIMAVIVALTAIMFSCVDDDFDTPPSTPITIGEIITIEEMKDIYNTNGSYTFTVDVSLYATVTMDDKSGNIYKTAYIQDATGAIALHLDAAGGIYQGDSIRIQLKGLGIGKYKSLFQIDALDGSGFTLDNYITKIQTLVNVEPEITTIGHIDSNKTQYQGRLVKLENVQFVASNTAVTYADAENEISVSLTIEDGTNTAIVRTSGYAGFADEKTPTGSGSIIAIVGQYNDDMQLIIRTTEEVIMENERFSGVASTFDDPYNVAYAVDNNSGENVWVEGYIVGIYETKDASGNDLAEFVPSFTAPFYTDANIIIADSETETDIANCLIVQLTSGEIRNTLNLVDNTTNKGKQVKVYGDLTTYFGDEGLKNTAGYWFEGSGINPDDPVGVVILGTSTTVASLNESFAGVSENVDFEGTGWLNANVQGERYWQGKVYQSNGYLQATAYGATAETLESWVVTPGVDLSTAKKLSFDTKTGYYKHAGLSVHVSTDFDGNNNNLFTSTWTELTSATIATGPGDGYGDWVSSGDVDLSAYSGTIYVLFKYVGDNSSNTTTFQLDNVKIIDL